MAMPTSASVVPLIGLSWILSSYIETRASEELAASAVGFASAAQKLIDDAIAPIDLNGPEADQKNPELALGGRD